MKKQFGLSLIEIMITLVIGLFLLLTVGTIYINTIRSSADTIKATRLNHDLEMAMNLMINDIKRAGYWGGARTGSSSRNNPFTQTTTDIQIPSSGCILYSYDANNDGATTPTDLTDDVDSDEYYGFRLSNGTLEMRLSGSTTSDCTNGSWQEFIDGNTLNITDLQFSFSALSASGNYPALAATSRCIDFTTTSTNNTVDNTTCTGITATPTPTATAQHEITVKRVVNVRITGTLDDDTSVVKSISGTVEVRNNRLFRISAAP